jgi:glycosyltransferase involved in cell wall biosynthesis
MLYLNAQVVSGLGEDTFWTWMKRELGDLSSFGLPIKIQPNDIILQYSTLGSNKFPNNTISLLWELHPEMKRALNDPSIDPIINIIADSARKSFKKTVTSTIMVEFYKDFGQIDVLPIGVDTDLFKPTDNKLEIRKKYNLPIDKKIGIWCGTTHPMKGFDKLLQYKNDNPDIYWIVVWKQACEAGNLEGASNFTHISQLQLSELLACSDFFLSCGLLRPFFMVEWEAMACNLPMVILDGIKKDFVPSLNPRDDIFRLGWDRKSSINIWKQYIGII